MTLNYLKTQMNQMSLNYLMNQNYLMNPNFRKTLQMHHDQRNLMSQMYQNYQQEMRHLLRLHPIFLL